MKSEMPFHGVAAPALRAICRKVFAAHPLSDAPTWRSAVLTLWRGAEFREERYAAVELAGLKETRAFEDLEAVPMYEEMIVTGAWWDTVDAIASHRIGALLRSHPAEMKRILSTWTRSENIWKRRSVILSQLGFRDQTDTAFLFASIEPSLGSKEFFLRKAIGWALRQHARIDPHVVIRYVQDRGDTLSPLSRREALKHLTVPKEIA
jgi:3-methyladenine DNA glycosylase AlkD